MTDKQSSAAVLVCGGMIMGLALTQVRDGTAVLYGQYDLDGRWTAHGRATVTRERVWMERAHEGLEQRPVFAVRVGECSS